MKHNRLSYLKSFLVPCLFFSLAAGACTGVLIFLFKLCASAVIACSNLLYAQVRANPVFLPLLLLGAITVGFAASVLLKRIPECRGGGIPTAIALLRGIVTFRWLRSMISVFFSAMLTYLCGVPLGNEGPSVQMGAAVGRGVVAKHPAWSRYIMTGGACAGFASATGAPLTGILFAFEEAHRRFSPLLFLTASISALTGSAVTRALCSLTQTDWMLFRFESSAPLPMTYYWVAPVIGILCGLAAALFAKGYRIIRRLVHRIPEKVPFFVKVTAVFLLTAIIGFFSPHAIGSGHDLTDKLMEHCALPLLLVPILMIRALLLLLANNSDVTGGLFVPTLAFGAILGSLAGKVLILLGILPEAYYSLAVVMGITAFLSASSRTPLMAVTFALEMLGGIPNLLPIAIGGAIAFLCIETVGIPDFTDTVVESKAEAARRGKTARVVDLHLTVSPDSFVVGKEIRDILWPASCMILSVKRTDSTHTNGGTGMCAGDVLFVHYQTYDPEATMRSLEELVGKQTPTDTQIHHAEENDNMPDL